MGQRLTYLVRIYKPVRGDRAFVVKSWMPARQFPLIESEVRAVLDSFRAISRGAVP
jgi:hypothetical protein